MPFITYNVEKNLFDNLKKLNLVKFYKFINDIEDLNISNKAILVESEKNRTLKNLSIKSKELGNKIMGSVKLTGIKIALDEAYKVLGKSNLCELSDQRTNKIKLDFVKNLDNEIDRKFKKKYIKGQFVPKDFDFEIEKFKENFLERIKYFILSKSLEAERNKTKNKINKIYIFHKELAKMALPVHGKRTAEIKNRKKTYDKAYLERDFEEYLKDESFNFNLTKNIKKIKYGIDLILNWWLKMPNSIMPTELNIFSDLPPGLEGENKSNIIKAREMFNKFLFKHLLDHPKLKTNFEFVHRDTFDVYEWWTHKRHFVFGSELQFVFSSQFGVELVSEKLVEKLRPVTVINVEDDKEDRHMLHLKSFIQKRTIS